MLPWEPGGQGPRGQVLGDPGLEAGEGAELHRGCSWAT